MMPYRRNKSPTSAVREANKFKQNCFLTGERGDVAFNRIDQIELGFPKVTFPLCGGLGLL